MGPLSHGRRPRWSGRRAAAGGDRRDRRRDRRPASARPTPEPDARPSHAGARGSARPPRPGHSDCRGCPRASPRDVCCRRAGRLRAPREDARVCGRARGGAGAPRGHRGCRADRTSRSTRARRRDRAASSGRSASQRASGPGRSKIQMVCRDGEGSERRSRSTAAGARVPEQSAEAASAIVMSGRERRGPKPRFEGAHSAAPGPHRPQRPPLGDLREH